jgi:hypothetical protein
MPPPGLQSVCDSQGGLMPKHISLTRSCASIVQALQVSETRASAALAHALCAARSSCTSHCPVDMKPLTLASLHHSPSSASATQSRMASPKS